MSEELLVRHCSPTLAGLKTGNLFSCSYQSAELLKQQLRSLNRRLSGKGLRILPLRMSGGKALIYVYRPARLREDLVGDDARQLLESRGYAHCQAEYCLVQLVQRLQEQGEFPHEIGLFLGYPPEDVRGFIDHQARDSKCTGCWKVYGDEAEARARFDRYKKCTASYIRQLKKGRSIDGLAVAM